MRHHFLKLLNKRLVQVQEKFIRNPYVIGYPFHLVLETGNRCNLKCPLCPTPFREKRIPSGRLTIENARRILDQFPYLIHANLSLWGEPFLNKDIFEIIAYARSLEIEVLVQSNLNILNEEMASRIVDSNLNQLQISLDGASQETYEKYRVEGDFSKVMQNILLIKQMQALKNNYNTSIIWKMVVHKFNEHEIEVARRRASDLEIEFKLVEIYTPNSLESEWKPNTLVSSSPEAYTDAVSRCYSLWQVATVNFNGEVLPCCSEFSPYDSLGNIFETPFPRIWNGPKYRALRRMNKFRLNCAACHADKETNWYNLWMK